MVDDPQTTESAWSPSQSQRREAILAGDVLGMAGPGKKIAGKLNGYARGVLPIGASHLTMFIDVQQRALFWLIAAWEENFTGYIVDYGTWPDQRRAYFTLRDIHRTLAGEAAGAGLEGSIYAGLEKLCNERLPRAYHREDGTEAKIDRLLSEHLTAEYRVQTMARDRTVDEWKLRAERQDNHWFDCLVGTAVAASIQDVTLSSVAAQASGPRKRIKLSSLQRGRK